MLDVKEEKQYEKLRKMGQRLHIPIPEAFWTLEVLDKDGNLLSKHEQRSHSWVRNAYNMMFTHLALKDGDDGVFGAGLLNTKDTGGATLSGNGPGWADSFSSVDDTGHGYRAAAADDDCGILVGSGVNAESFEDYVLQTKIINGTGAGNLSYILSEAHAINYNAGTKVLKNDLVRYFNNNSGGNVSVNEVALVNAGRNMSGGDKDILASRDKLGTTVTIPDTGQLKVTYTVQLTYPA